MLGSIVFHTIWGCNNTSDTNSLLVAEPTVNDKHSALKFGDNLDLGRRQKYLGLDVYSLDRHTFR